LNNKGFDLLVSFFCYTTLLASNDDPVSLTVVTISRLDRYCHGSDGPATAVCLAEGLHTRRRTKLTATPEHRSQPSLCQPTGR
jgi:hypothetical protein